MSTQEYRTLVEGDTVRYLGGSRTRLDAKPGDVFPVLYGIRDRGAQDPLAVSIYGQHVMIRVKGRAVILPYESALDHFEVEAKVNG